MTRREELIVGLMRNYDLARSSLCEGVKGDDGSVGLLPHARHCLMRKDNGFRGYVRCSCWLKSIKELERCLQIMRREERRLWYQVYERYMAATTKPMTVLVSRNKPLVERNVEVIGLVNKTDLNKRGDGQTRVLVEIWRPGLDPKLIGEGVGWLARTFVGAPELPLELLSAAA